MASSTLSPHSLATLRHLRSLSPTSGYSIELRPSNGNQLVILKRRNVPLHDEGFLDLVVHQGRVAGLRVLTARGEFARGVILVERDGSIQKVDRGGVVIDIPMKETLAEEGMDGVRSSLSSLRSSMNGSTVRSTISGVSGSSVLSSMNGPRPSFLSSTRTTTTIPDPSIDTISDEDNLLLLKYGIAILAGLLLLKSVLSLLNGFAALLLPLIIYYAMQTCPSNQSFDTKRELKRVMRGAHLPEEQQPKGFFERGIQRIAASIGTEIATGLGYELRIDGYGGLGKVAWVRVPAAGMDFYWVGVFGKWRYIHSREITVGEKKND